MEWLIKPFAGLTPNELYAVLQLRMEVFVVEQQCIYQDCDDKDQPAHHLMAWQEGKLAACTRLLPAGISYAEPSIGRVITSPAFRGISLGRELMTRSIEACYELFGKQPIRIGAQQYLEKFYESFGFRRVSEPYDEDGIQHIKMLLS